ncbi:MAG: prephenate dehydrogenase/arogenate dehydrogenase family protein [Pseudomonadota bacterium]
MKITIYGFGRFGQILAQILKTQFKVEVFDSKKNLSKIAKKLKVDFVSKKQACQNEVIFICVPINQFSRTISSIMKIAQDGATIVETCSVNLHPAQEMKKYDSSKYTFISSHPLFGPDSFNPLTKKHLKPNWIIYPVGKKSKDYHLWKRNLKQIGFNVVEMSPDEHDRIAANSQALTHYIGRILKELNIQDSHLSTLGFNRLMQLMQQTCNDSKQLFSDMMNYNPYAISMKNKFLTSITKVNKSLIDDYLKKYN